MRMDSPVVTDTDVPPSGAGVVRSLSAAVTAMFRRRWRMFSAVAVTVFVIGVALTMMLPARYDAVAQVKIDPSSNAALGQMDGERPDQSIFDTEVSVVSSRAVATAVVRNLGLVNDPELTKDMPPLPANATPAQRDARVERIATKLLSGLTAERDKMTYIVDIGYRAANPTLAANVANGFASEYIDYSRGRRTGVASRETDYLDERLAKLNAQASDADARLAQYRANAGIVGDGSITASNQQITPLASQLATAESEAAAAGARLNVAQQQVNAGGLDNVSAVLNSSVIADLRSQRAQIVQRQGDVLSRYGPRHPESIKVTEQLQAIDTQIKEEANRTIGGLRSEANAANARAASLRGEMARLRGEQSGETRASALAETYQRQADAAHSAYNKLSEQSQAMSQVARSSLTQAQVVELALPSSRPTSPNRPLLIALSLVAGLVLATVIIGAQEVLSSGLYTIDDLEQFGLPVLATIPRLRGTKSGTTPSRYLTDRPMSAYAEAFRNLRRSLGDAKTVAIVSTLPGEGKTSTALALARICAMSKERVLLLDTDLRRAGLIVAAEIQPTEGLVEVLNGAKKIEQVIISDVVQGLDLLPVANRSFLVEDLFASAALRTLIADAEGRYDRIIIDTPPLLGVADARAAPGIADTTVMVVKWGETPAAAVRSALNRLIYDEVDVAGTVYSMVDVSAEAYGALYYSPKYASYYAGD